MKITYTPLHLCIACIACMIFPNLTNAQQQAERIGNVTTPAFGKIQDSDGNVVGFAYSTLEGDATLTDLDFQAFDSFSIPCPDLRTSLDVLDLGATTPFGRYVITTTCDDRLSTSGIPTTFFRDAGAFVDSASFTRSRLLLHGGRAYMELDGGSQTQIVDLNTYDTVFTYSSFDSFDPVNLATGAVFVQERLRDFAILDLDFNEIGSFSEDLLEADTLTRFDGGRISPVDILEDGKVDFFGSGIIGTGSDAMNYNYVTNQDGEFLLGGSASVNRPFFADAAWSTDYYFRAEFTSAIQEVLLASDGLPTVFSIGSTTYQYDVFQDMPVVFTSDGTDATIVNPERGQMIGTLPAGIVVGNARYNIEGLTSLSSSTATAYYRGFNSNNNQEFVLAENDQLLWSFEGLGEAEILELQEDSVRIIVRDFRGSNLEDYEVNVYKLSRQPSSVSEIAVDDRFVASPNPARDAFYLSHSELLQSTTGLLRMIDISGRSYDLGQVQLGQAVNTSSLPAGMYAIDLRLASGERYVTRVVIR